MLHRPEHWPSELLMSKRGWNKFVRGLGKVTKYITNVATGGGSVKTCKHCGKEV